jgi:hypothetical protein
MWDASQENETQMTIAGKDSTHRLANKTKWRLSGFATVRGHRCAVLEGIAQTEGKLTGNVENETRAKNRTVVYFDYRSGISVERIAYTLSPGKNGTAPVESQMIQTLVE